MVWQAKQARRNRHRLYALCRGNSLNDQLDVNADKTIEQNSKIIGSFKPTGSYNGQDFYEFQLPSGITIAKISFAGGNN